MARAFFTIGHSNRSMAEFAALLRDPDVKRVVDVRKMPMSRSNPQFNGEALASALALLGIGYEHLAPLGGLRGKTQGLPAALNGFWTNPSFHNYADYALSAPFRAGLELLRDIGHRQSCAIMCSEAVWWRCHRRIIADYLIAAGEPVFHIMGGDRLEPARLTPGAVPQPEGGIIYPAPPLRPAAPGPAG